MKIFHTRKFYIPFFTMPNTSSFKPLQGFTLIELLIALTIVTILAVAVYAALNPAQRLKDSKDARRSANISEILTAVHQSIIDNKGAYPANMPAIGVERQLGTGDTTTCTAAVGTYCSGMTTGCVDLMSGSPALTSYLASMPIDPLAGTTATAAKTGFSIKRDANGIVTIKACYTDAAAVLSVSR